MGASWFALKGVPDQGGGSLGVWDSQGERPVVDCRPATPHSYPSRGLVMWDLFIYLSSIIEWRPRQARKSGQLKPPALSSSVAANIFVGIYLSSIIETLYP